MNEGGKEGGREAVGGWVNEGGIPTSSQISSTKRLKIAANLDPQSLFFRHLKQRDPENEVNTRGGGKNTWERSRLDCDHKIEQLVKDRHEQFSSSVNRVSVILPLVTFQVTSSEPFSYFLKHSFSENCNHVPEGRQEQKIEQ